MTATRAQFLFVLKDELRARFGWAQTPARLDAYMGRVSDTIDGHGTELPEGAAYKAALARCAMPPDADIHTLQSLEAQ